MEILVIIRLCCNCTYGEGWRGLWCGGSVSPAEMLTSLRDGGGFVLCNLKLGSSLFRALLNRLAPAEWPCAHLAHGARVGGGDGERAAQWGSAERLLWGGVLLLLVGCCEHLEAAMPFLAPCFSACCHPAPGDRGDRDGAGEGVGAVPDQPLLGTRWAPRCFVCSP